MTVYDRPRIVGGHRHDIKVALRSNIDSWYISVGGGVKDVENEDGEIISKWP